MPILPVRPALGDCFVARLLTTITALFMVLAGAFMPLMQIFYHHLSPWREPVFLLGGAWHLSSKKSTARAGWLSQQPYKRLPPSRYRFGMGVDVALPDRFRRATMVIGASKPGLTFAVRYGALTASADEKSRLL